MRGESKTWEKLAPGVRVPEFQLPEVVVWLTAPSLVHRTASPTLMVLVFGLYALSTIATVTVFGAWVVVVVGGVVVGGVVVGGVVVGGVVVGGVVVGGVVVGGVVVGRVVVPGGAMVVDSGEVVAVPTSPVLLLAAPEIDVVPPEIGVVSSSTVEVVVTWPTVVVGTVVEEVVVAAASRSVESVESETTRFWTSHQMGTDSRTIATPTTALTSQVDTPPPPSLLGSGFATDGDHFSSIFPSQRARALCWCG